jgi:hypothetical protein
MDEPRLDVLLRKAAQQSTRREALATLIGGALLLHNPDPGQATREAQRRRRHKRNAVVYRSISIEIDNSAGTKLVIINHG